LTKELAARTVSVFFPEVFSQEGSEFGEDAEEDPQALTMSPAQTIESNFFTASW
jgi:hypothetical protein